MNWKKESERGRNERLRKWHRYFAWLPVEVGEYEEIDEYVWLEFVERRASFSTYGGLKWYHYRKIGSNIDEQFNP